MKQGNGLRIHRASLFHAIRIAYVLHSEYYKIFTYAILSNLPFAYLPCHLGGCPLPGLLLRRTPFKGKSILQKAVLKHHF